MVTCKQPKITELVIAAIIRFRQFGLKICALNHQLCYNLQNGEIPFWRGLRFYLFTFSFFYFFAFPEKGWLCLWLWVCMCVCVCVLSLSLFYILCSSLSLPLCFPLWSVFCVCLCFYTSLWEGGFCEVEVASGWQRIDIKRIGKHGSCLLRNVYSIVERNKYKYVNM